MNFKYIKILFNNYLYGVRKYLVCGALALIAGSYLSYLPPLFARFIIDSVLMGDAPTGIVGSIAEKHNLIPVIKDNMWLCLVLLITPAALQGICVIIRSKYVSISAEFAAKKLRTILYEHIQHLEFHAGQTMNSGEMIQRCSSDIETVRTFIEGQLVEVGRLLVMIAWAFPIMYSISPKMCLWSTMSLPVLIIGSIFYFYYIQKIHRKTNEAEEVMTEVIRENLSGMRLVKAFGTEKKELVRFNDANTDHRKLYYRMMQTLSNYWGFSAFICMLQIMIVIIAGTYYAIDKQISLGTLTTFISYVTVLVWPLRSMGHVLSEMGRSIVSLERLEEILQQPKEVINNGIIPEKLEGKIEFRNVNFSYNQDSPPALNNISFTIEPGTVAAIVGPTASGKSTLIHLLPGLIRPESGDIFIDDINITEYNLKELRKKIGIVLQDPFLFSKSILENINMGADGDIDLDDIVSVSKDADIHTTVSEKFTKGYDTVIGEKGITLSGGERQRVAIARALAGNPDMLIFDDSLSAVDEDTDRRIQKALKENRGKTTTFIVSHRISTVSQADIIIVLENGKIAGIGQHDDLIKQDGFYARFAAIKDELRHELEEDIYE